MTETEQDSGRAMRSAIYIMKHSIYKPDAELRLEAKGGECYDELMLVRHLTIKFLENLSKEYNV